MSAEYSSRSSGKKLQNILYEIYLNEILNNGNNVVRIYEYLIINEKISLQLTEIKLNINRFEYLSPSETAA